MDTNVDQILGEEAIPGVDPSLFRVDAHHWFGPFYAVDVYDREADRQIRLFRGGRVLIGRSSVRRAVRYGVERYLRSHPS